MTKMLCKYRDEETVTNLNSRPAESHNQLRYMKFLAMRALHGPLVNFFLVALGEFLILSTCDLATSLLHLSNILFLDMDVTCGSMFDVRFGASAPCVFGCNARIEGLRILRLPDVKPPCLTCPRPFGRGFFLACGMRHRRRDLPSFPLWANPPAGILCNYKVFILNKRTDGL